MGRRRRRGRGGAGQVCEMFQWTTHLKGGQKDNPTLYAAAAVAVGQKVYAFGGNGKMKDSDPIEVHVFNTVPLRWRKLPLVTTRRGERPTEVPSMRFYHTAVLIEDITYIWGGRNCSPEYYNVLHAFDLDTHRWFKPMISGTVPEAMAGHSACGLGKIMYVYGGCISPTGSTNNIYKLDTTIMVWTLINTKGNPPSVSYCHSATIIGTKMFVFGGQSNHYDFYNTISVFDTETNRWLNTPSGHLLPEGRSNHSAFTYNGELYIFGGYKRNGYMNDLWKYNPETFSWKKVEPKGKGPLHPALMSCCMVGDRIVLFGWNTPMTHVMDLNPSLKTLCKITVIQYGLEQSELTHDIRWELAAMTTS